MLNSSYPVCNLELWKIFSGQFVVGNRVGISEVSVVKLNTILILNKQQQIREVIIKKKK